MVNEGSLLCAVGQGVIQPHHQEVDLTLALAAIVAGRTTDGHVTESHTTEGLVLGTKEGCQSTSIRAKREISHGRF